MNAAQPNCGHAVGSGQEGTVENIAKLFVRLRFHDPVHAGHAHITMFSAIQQRLSPAKSQVHIQRAHTDAKNIHPRRLRRRGYHALTHITAGS